jgi:hypothetical protein
VSSGDGGGRCSIGTTCPITSATASTSSANAPRRHFPRRRASAANFDDYRRHTPTSRAARRTHQVRPAVADGSGRLSNCRGSHGPVEDEGTRRISVVVVIATTFVTAWSTKPEPPVTNTRIQPLVLASKTSTRAPLSSTALGYEGAISATYQGWAFSQLQ